MSAGKVVFLSALTTIGGTLLFRKVKTKVPGFSPAG